MKKIFWIILGLNTLMLADFTRSGSIVTDTNTGLQWQDDNVSSAVTWEEAIAQCEESSLGDHHDWRLPNLNELISLVDDTLYNASISSVFQNTLPDNYWSSTVYANNKGYAWCIRFSDGYQHYYVKYKNFYVRCVRAGG